MPDTETRCSECETVFTTVTGNGIEVEPHCCSCSMCEECQTCEECYRVRFENGHGCRCRSCYSCGSMVPPSQREAINGDRYCFGCAEDYRGESDDYSSGEIDSYGSVPNRVCFRSVDSESEFNGHYDYPEAPDSEPYLGIELEWEAAHGSPTEIARVWNSSGIGWTTHDSSLSHGGESKCHPSTYHYLRDCGLVETLAEMVTVGGRAWNYESTGAHVHVSCSAFEHPSAQWRFAWLQVTALRRQMETLAGRRYSWPQGTPEQQRRDITSRGYAVSPLSVIAKKAGSTARGVAVNVDGGNTMELRYWKGTLNGPVVLGQLAVIDALISYAKALTFRNVRNGVSWLQFSEWASENLDARQIADIGSLCAARHVGWTVGGNGVVESASCA